jgi:hypothetical protein
MQGDIRVVASHLNLVQAPDQIEAAITKDLYFDRKKVLIIKGRPAVEAVAAIYKEFSVRKDLAGNAFRLSHKEKSVMATDQWGEISKVNMKDFKRFIQA